MNRLLNTFACVALLTATATAQASAWSDGTPGPALGYQRNATTQMVTVTCGPLADHGALFLLASFDGQLASLGKGLPSILANSAVVAMTFTPGEEIAISTWWPPVHVLLQAVEVRFKPFDVATSDVVQIGAGPITDDMVAAARQARDDATAAADHNGDGIVDRHDWK